MFLHAVPLADLWEGTGGELRSEGQPLPQFCSYFECKVSVWTRLVGADRNASVWLQSWAST